MIEPGNIDTSKRPVVHNKDGSISTVRSITVEQDGKFILIPTVVGKKVVSNNQAMNHFTKTGEHLGIFNSEQSADAFAQSLHEEQAQEYGAGPSIPKGPPIPALQQYGVNMGIYDVNNQVQQLTDVYRQKFGHSPPPGLIFDILKAHGQTGPMDYNKLFGIPTSIRDAQNAGIARMGSGDPIATLPILYPKADELVKGMQESIHADRGTSKFGPITPGEGSDTVLHAFFKENDEFIKHAMSDPEQRQILVKGLMDVGVVRAAQQLSYNVQTSGVVPSGITKVIAESLRPVEQIVTSTADFPFGFYQLVRGVGLDVYDVSTVGIHSMATNFGLDKFGIDVKPSKEKPLHTLHIAERMGQQVIQDFTDPKNNSGYLTMDLWAAFTAGSGVVGRIGAASRAEGFAATARALAFKAKPEWTDMGWGSYQQSLPLSDTYAVRFLQENTPFFGRTVRQARLEAEQTHGYVGVSVPQLINEYFSTPSMMRRALSKDVQIQLAVAMTPMVEMQRLVQWDQWAKSTFKEYVGDWKNKSWRDVALKQRLGVQKALQMIFTDDPDPVGMWRGYHERQIQSIAEQRANHLTSHVDKMIEDDPSLSRDEAVTTLGVNRRFTRQDKSLEYSFQAHKAQLEALELAQQIILDPPERFGKILDRAYEVQSLRENMLHELSGFSYEQMDQHNAEVAGVGRGENIIPMGDGTKGVSPEPVAHIFENHSLIENRLANAKIRLSKAERNERLHPGSMTDEVNAAKSAVTNHEVLLEASKERMKVAQSKARPLKTIIGANGKVSHEFLTQDAERIAKEFGVEVVWAGKGTKSNALRSQSIYVKLKDIKTGKTRGVIGVPKPGEGYKQPLVTRKLDRIMYDKKHGRDETNDYMVALHEIGHHVFDSKPELFTESKSWIKNIDEKMGINKKSDQLGLIEEEAAVTLFAFKHSSEPIRQSVLDQMTNFFDSYTDAYRKDFNSEPELGPAANELMAMVGDDSLADIRQGTPGSAYFPTQPEKYRSGRIMQKLGKGRTRFGVRPVDFPIKAWSGKSLEMGDFRWDMTNLLAEQFQYAYKAATQHVQWKDLWGASIDEPLTENHRAIRDIKTIPDELRLFVESMERSQLDQHFASIVTDSKMDELRKFLYPTHEEIRAGTVPHEHVRYVDERLILDKVGGRDTSFWKGIDDVMSGIMAPVNEPMRLMLIFATPAYALNALGSAALLLTQTGFLAPEALWKATFSHRHYGPEVTRLLDRLAGNTHASSLFSEGEGKWWTMGSQALQNGWGKVTDTYFRRAAVIHELERHGLLKGDNHIDELLHEANQKKVNQAAQTARKAMLDFNSLSWPERATLRHIFFVYSFVRSSGIWSLRYLRDHGFQADVLAQAGRDREQNVEKLIGHMPSWFMRAGYFAVHPDTIYNPIQWNMPGMLEQIATPVASIFGHTPYSSAAELWGPAATAGTEIFTGTDPQGRALPGGGGNLQKALLALYAQTPMGQIGVKQQKAAKEAANPLKPEPIESSFANPISSAMGRERSGLNQSVFDVAGFWNQWGLAAFRSGITRGVNPVAGEARYWRDLRQSDPTAFHQHEMTKVMEMIKRQQKVVGDTIPGDALRAVDTVAHVSQAIEDYKLKHAGEPTPNDKTIAMITLDTLVSEGHVKDKQKWANEIKNAVDPATVHTIRLQLLMQAGGQAWKNWVDKVNKIDTYAQVKYESVTRNLSNLGLGDYSATTSAPKEDRWAYGRKAEDVLAQSKMLSAKVASLSGYAQQAARQEWIKYVNDNDHEVVINGKTYPSPLAYEFADKTPDEQSKAIAVYAKRKPSETTALQEQLLTGQRPSPIVVEGWGTLATWMKQEKAKLPFGTNPPAGLRTYYGNFLAKASPDFKKAWQFEQQPLVKRLQSYKTIQESPNKDAWDFILSNTAQRYDQFVTAYKRPDGTVNKSLVASAWKLDVPKLAAVIDSKYGNTPFMSELHLYTGATSAETEDAYLTKFLTKLVSP